MAFIDLSHTVEDSMITYPGLPGPLICDFLSREASKQKYAEGTTFQIGKIEMVSNTGTYIDTPFHRYADGKDLSEIDLPQLADLPAILVRIPPGSPRAIDRPSFENLPVQGKAVLIHTGWSQHWRTAQYLHGHPFLTASAAAYLAQQGAVLVGIDSLNIDDTDDGTRPVHTTLLGAGILIVEHMCNMDQLPEDNFRFTAVPVKIKGMGTFPVRAFATIAR